MLYVFLEITHDYHVSNFGWSLEPEDEKLTLGEYRETATINKAKFGITERTVNANLNRISLKETIRFIGMAPIVVTLQADDYAGRNPVLSL
jgi:hypothetical protein